MFHVPNHLRLRTGPYGSDNGAGNNGAFMYQNLVGTKFKIIASDGEGWQHVSVSTENRCPTWNEMCAIKDMFWDDDDCVVQFHPAKKDYVNNHKFCLHLWKPTLQMLPIPESVLVGVK